MTVALLTFSVPSGNGAGPALATSGLGPEKTVLVDGTSMTGFLVFQGSNDGGTTWADIPDVRYNDTEQEPRTLHGTYTHMRVRRQRVQPGTPVPSATIGALASENFESGTLSIPLTPGVGAPVAIANGGTLITAIISASDGRISIEASQEAAGDNFAPILVFGSDSSEDQRIQLASGAYARLRARRVTTDDEGMTPVLSFSAANGASSGLTFGGPMFNLDSGVIRYDNAKVVALADAANIATDASLGNAFFVAMSGARTFDVPSNPRETQKITYIVEQLIATSVPVWASGAGGFRFASAGSPQGVKIADLNALFAAATANSIVRVGFEYLTSDDRWDCVGIAGYFV